MSDSIRVSHCRSNILICYSHERIDCSQTSREHFIKYIGNTRTPAEFRHFKATLRSIALNEVGYISSKLGKDFQQQLILFIRISIRSFSQRIKFCLHFFTTISKTTTLLITSASAIIAPMRALILGSVSLTSKC